MISERSFASSFEGFWSELLPLLTPTFLHTMSEMYKEPLTDPFGIPLKPIPKAADTASAVVAEFAFYLAKCAIQNGITVRTAFGDEGLRSNAEMTAADAVRRYEGAFQYPSVKLRNDELSEGFMIAENYQRFFAQIPRMDRPEFEPTVRGAGFLETCRADVSIGQALFEVKTVDRNLASKDIRQLIVYLALQAATGERRWTVGGFFNPRKAEYHEFAVDDLIAQISGGRSSSEVYHTLVHFACSWDIQFDTAF